MGQIVGATQTYDSSPDNTGKSGMRSFVITKHDTNEIPDHNYVHCSTTAGTVTGWLIGDDPTDGAPRTFNLNLGDNMLRFRVIKTGGTAVGLLGIK